MLYGIVGGFNTILCWTIMFGLMWFGVMPEIANFVSYVIGILNSYILNKKFTFKSTNSHKQDFLRFGVAMGIAFLVNLIVLIISHRYFGIDKYISQIIAAIFYTITGYIISKFWAFKQA